MIPEVRKAFNEQYTDAAYQHALNIIEQKYPGDLVFRVAETPVFLSEKLVQQLEEASAQIVEQLENKELLANMDRAVPKEYFVPGDEGLCEMFSLDFGICKNENGETVPQLIELQGFPTMFLFQEIEAEAYHRAYSIDESWTNFFNGYDSAQYEKLLKDLILKDHQPEEVILLELLPAEQKTRIDFAATKEKTGISAVCISDVFEENGNVYYEKGGKKIQVKRIYNRMIFDDFEMHKKELKHYLDITKPLNVEWCPHPNWFYKISKYTLPFLKSGYVPFTSFLSDVNVLPDDLENYVLKPLFSFAGQGVLIDVTKDEITNIKDPENWILQKKVQYEPIIKTPDGDAVFEIRLMFFREPNTGKPILVNNLTRLSKGKMVGVRYNADKTWVGSSIGFFKKK